MKRAVRDDPVEAVIVSAFTAAGISFVRERDGGTLELDFHLPDLNVYVECKQFHTDRIAAQMKRAPNVICIQGMEAARAFARMIELAKSTGY